MKERRTTEGRRARVAVLTAALTAILTATAPTQVARSQVFMTRTGHAEFTSSVPLHSFTGSSDRLVGNIDLAAGTVDFYLDLETLDTGIGKRDKDMRKTLETGKFPFAEFFGRFETPPDLSPRKQPVRVRGTFTIHGVAREIVVVGSMTHDGSALGLEAAWELRLEDYGIEPPSLLIMKVDQVQKLAINARLAPESP